MKIINPLYDLAFKYLMANERLAKRALSVLLDQEILELSIGQQETLLSDEKRGLTLFRLDFKAIIKEADGTSKKVLIELQKSKYDMKSFFIEHLTHQSHIIQLRRLPELRQTRLEQFLSLFNQAWITSDKFILDLQDIPAEFKDMAKYLQGPTMDDDFRRRLEAEDELDTIFDKQEEKYLKQIEVAQQKEKEATKRETDLAIKFALRLRKLGFNLKDIAKETDLEIEVLKIL
ncbi:MAG: hypothetical protein B7C24_09975 [Bacteroidetes bacterium 4572_77]|nr:MAG: hypothetical protein B7C24_09975 [Bacteroidetes bacterium 4572_77]